MKDDSLQQLIEGYFSHELSDIELEQLKVVVKEDPIFRKRFIDECLVHEEMCQILIEKIFEGE